MNTHVAASIAFCLVFVSIIAIPDMIHSCSIICLQDSASVVMGYNFDWYKEVRGLVIVNERNVAKVALMPWNDTPARWTSKYGSITFNGCGRDMPFSGMNEAGLVVAQAWQGDAVYPEIDDRPALSELQWIQYHLDNSATVDEVIESDKSIRITKYTTAPLHFLAIDRSGNIAVIEFSGGNLVTSHGDDLPLPLLTNTKYSKCLNDLIAYMDFGNGDADPKVENRFIRGAHMIKAFKERSEAPLVENAFNALEYVKQKGTRWSIAYDNKNLQVHYKTSKNEAMATLKFDDFDFDCASKDLMLDIDKPHDDTSGGFVRYSAVLNREVALFFGKTIPNSPAEVWECIANYPESLRCGE